ncbi:phage tail protein [Lysobacter sp. F6437]|uniref:phage tail protein n=1 Tax=Lysobacter sp. F6437 TaxID=3459296 RepID=UPI00403DA0FB
MSGAQIGTVVGGIVGAFFGAPQLGMAIGGLIGGAIDPEVIKAPGIGDAQKQTTQAGVPRPVVFGHPAPFMGNIIDGEHKARKITVEEGGKGGPVVEQERFLLTSAIRICEGPIAGVVRIWRNGEVVYDRRSNEDIEAVFKPEGASATSALLSYVAEMRAKTAAFQNRVRIYLGDEDQLPDPALEAIHGVGNTPYYRGTAYIVIEDDDVTDTRGACAQYEFEVMASGAEEPVLLVAPNTVPHLLFKNEGHLTNPGAKAFYYPLLSDVGKIFRFYAATQPHWGHRFRVFPILSEPPEEHTVEVDFADAEAMHGAIFDTGWWISEDTSTELFEDAFEGIGVPAPTASFGVPPDETFRCINNCVGLVLLSEFMGGGGPGHNIGSASVAYPYLEDMTVTLVPEQQDLMLASDGNLYIPEWVTMEGMESISAVDTTLAAVVEDVSIRCGVPGEMIDVTALNDVIPGFLIAQQFTGADCLRPTQQMYFYDMPEIDGKIVAVKRGGESVATITDDDMLDAGDEDEDTRAQAIEFPLKVSVITRDPAADYNPMPQTSSRYSSTVNALGETQIASPIPFGADEGAQRADIIHKVLWAQAEGRSEFELPEEWTRLTPSDCFDRNGKRWMAESVEYADGSVRVKSVYDRASNYVSTATGIAAPPPVVPESGLRGPTELAVMNLPALREQDNVAGAYLAVTGSFPGWNGCTVQMSIDGGATYRTVATISRRSVMGRITGEVGPTTEPIPVTMDDGELYDSTSAALDLGVNAFALVPVAGQSEIGQFMAAAEGDPDEYQVTGTRRGVNGTDATTHVIGEQFVMLANALFLPINSSLYGSTLYFRAVTNGTVAENNSVVPFLFEAPPASADYLITESGDYLTTEANARLIVE